MSDWDIVAAAGHAITIMITVVGGGSIIVVGLALISDFGSGESGASVQSSAPYDEIHH